jgi:hypothetical protein
MATRKKTATRRAGSELTSKASAATAETATAPATFPPSDCAAGLPAETVFHETIFTEFKRLNVRIDDLPQAIVLDGWGDTNAKDKVVNLARKSAPMAQQYAATAAGSSPTVVSLAGGVPLTYVGERSFRALTAPLVQTVQVDDVARLLDRAQVTLPGGKAAKLTLSDGAVADLLADRPVTVAGTAAGKPVAVRIVPGSPGARRPKSGVHVVASLDEFVRNPSIPAMDGSGLRVRLSGAQLRQLRDSQSVMVTAAGRRVAVQIDSNGNGTGDGRAVARYAASVSGGGSVVTSVGEGLSGESTRSSGTVMEETAGTSVPSVPVQSETTFTLALYLPWRQLWRLHGYTRGELLHSLVLSPQEEVTIEVSSWDRRKRMFEDSAQSSFEQTTEFTETEKDTQSVVKEVNSQGEFGMTLGGQIGYTMAGVFNVGGSSQTSVKASLANSSKNNLEYLRESVAKAGTKLKLERQTKINETTEIGTESKITRKLRNPNLCHTLSFNSYEILAHYDIETSFDRDQARLCVLVPNPLSWKKFDYTNVRYYETVLRRVLLVPDLAGGFDAARKLFAQDKICEARHRNEVCTAAKSLGIGDTPDPTLVSLLGQIERAWTKLSGGLPLAAVVPPPWAFLVPYPVFTLTLLDEGSFQRWLYVRRAGQVAPGMMEAIRGLSALPDQPSKLQAVADAVAATGDLKDLRPATMTQDENSLYGAIKEAYKVPSPPVVFTDLPKAAYAVNDAGLTGYLAAFGERLAAIAQEKELARNKAAMEANQSAVKSDYSNKEIAEALEAVDALVEHLNHYQHHYRAAIFKLLPFPDEFQSLLSGFSQLVERRVIGYDGEHIAFPLNVTSDPRTAALFKELVLDNDELLDMETSQAITLPTSGVHMEGRVGGCDTCEEFIKATRHLDLELRRAQVRQAKAEAERLERRVDAAELDDPKPELPTLRVKLESPPAAAAPDD